MDESDDSFINLLKSWDIKSSSNVKLAIAPGEKGLKKMYDFTWGENHIEQPYKLVKILKELQNIKTKKCFTLDTKKVTSDVVGMVHDNSFLEKLKEYNPQGLEAKYSACGDVCGLLEEAIVGNIKAGFAIVRPAGHHSSTTSKGSFCGINSVMVGGILAASKGLKASIFDLDAHFAGGSEEILLNPKNSELSKNIHLLISISVFMIKKLGRKQSLLIMILSYYKILMMIIF